jgi:hypothetical protein
MGVQKLDKLPQEAVPLTRSADIKLVLDTPKGMFVFFYFSNLDPFVFCFVQDVNEKKEQREE